MNCPYCNCEMVKGVIKANSNAPLRWIQDAEKRGMLDKMEDYFNEENVIGKGHILKKTTVEGYKCKICNKIIIDGE